MKENVGKGKVCFLCMKTRYIKEGRLKILYFYGDISPIRWGWPDPQKKYSACQEKPLFAFVTPSLGSGSNEIFIKI